MAPRRPDDDHWSPGAALVRAVLSGVAAGLAMGLAYFLLTWLLQDWIRSTDFRRTYYGRYYTPLVLLPFFVTSGIFAVISLRLAERTFGGHGILLMIPIVATTAAAMAVAVGLCRLMITPWPERLWWVLLALGVGMLGGAVIKMLRSG